MYGDGDYVNHLGKLISHWGLRKGIQEQSKELSACISVQPPWLQPGFLWKSHWRLWVGSREKESLWSGSGMTLLPSAKKSMAEGTERRGE